jgi:hypothetical protein
VHDKLDVVTVLLTESSKRSTKQFDTIHASSCNVISVNHGVGQKLAIRLIIDESECISPGLRDSVDGRAVHARQEIGSKISRISPGCNFFVHLRFKKVSLSLGFYRTVRIVPGNWVRFMVSVSVRPEACT